MGKRAVFQYTLMKLKAIIFDVGGVLIRTPSRQNRANWEKELGLSEWESEELVFNSYMGKKAQLGLISDKELWSWIGHHLNLSQADLVIFKHDFWSGDIIDQELILLIRDLKKNFQTAIISNATETLRETLKKNQFEDAFDLIVCSAEENIMKPDYEIFRRTLERLGCSPEEAIYR
jgi:FMN phosphatase YigB (HAD superfamily)